MRRNVDPPFYPGEIVTGRVLKLLRNRAILDVRGWTMPLDKRLICWDALRCPSEVLSTGEKIEVMIQTYNHFDPIHKKAWAQISSKFEGFWLTRLPLLENPWPRLIAKYPEGSIVEIEIVDYTALHTARARFPKGLLVEVPTLGMIRYAQQKNRPVRSFHPKERFNVVVRGTMPFHYWLQPYFGKADWDGLVV